MADPTEPAPVAETATMTFAEWCVADPELAAADAAAYTEFYPPPPAPAPTAPAPAGSAFAKFYGPSAEQKMDRGTLDARIASMKAALTPPAPPPPPVEQPPA